MKTKICHRCKTVHTTLFRIQFQKGKIWVFVCEACCLHYKEQDFYRYGGTWKGYRH
jgi:RNase P subunit RPR2